MQKRILEECLRIARSKNTPETLGDEWGRSHHFSFLVQGNKIVAFSNNKAATPLSSYPRTAKCHSEPEAYFKGRSLLKRGKSFKMVNIRLDKIGNMRMSKPCRCCYDFISKLDCTEVYFTTEVGFASIKL